MMKKFDQARKEFKQRNLVHLNAPKSGAGKHTDRKKQMKQGVVKHKGQMYEAARIPRKAGQPAKSDKHSDLYTDEDPKGTIHGLKFATTEDAKRSVRKIKSSGRAHAHKIQAAIAMEQRAKVAGKTQAAAVYRSFIEQMKKKTKKMNEERIDEANPIARSAMRAIARISPTYKMARKELSSKIKNDPKKSKLTHAVSVAKKYNNVDAKTLHDVTEQRKGLYYYINKKRKEGRPMRKKGAKGAPKPSDFERAKQTASEQAQPTIGGVKMKRLGKSKPGGYKSLVSRHLGASAAEKIDKSDGAKLVAKGKKTGNTELIRKGNFIKNVISKK